MQRPIRDKPDRIKLPYALWSRQAAADRTLDQFDLRVAVRTTGACPRRWGSRQKEPMRRADQQSPAPVKRWIGTIDPDIAARARKERAEIHWGDVAGLTAMVCADAAIPITGSLYVIAKDWKLGVSKDCSA